MRAFSVGGGRTLESLNRICNFNGSGAFFFGENWNVHCASIAFDLLSVFCAGDDGGDAFGVEDEAEGGLDHCAFFAFCKEKEVAELLESSNGFVGGEATLAAVFFVELRAGVEVFAGEGA